ncbi:helix-turn-helix transcriptional regulator [Thermanaerothrix sp. 4228-RoL]|uniref:helix-turn-helix domain-containing protein n=1 Tax=Thermanaerothrix solaris TaxID=3058434 RepID=UPI0037DD8F96
MLTPFDLQILTWLAQGLSVAEMAALSGRSKRTVEFHLWRMRLRVGARTNPGLVYIACCYGVLSTSRRALSHLESKGVRPTPERSEGRRGKARVPPSPP